MRGLRPGMSLMVTAEGLILGKEYAVDEENGGKVHYGPNWNK